MLCAARVGAACFADATGALLKCALRLSDPFALAPCQFGGCQVLLTGHWHAAAICGRGVLFAASAVFDCSDPHYDSKSFVTLWGDIVTWELSLSAVQKVHGGPMHFLHCFAVTDTVGST
jgi:hypothetical protein